MIIKYLTGSDSGTYNRYYVLKQQQEIIRVNLRRYVKEFA